MNPNKSFQFPLNVRSYEAGPDGTCSISSICNYFQEAAGLHAEKLHFDISDLQRRGLTWILYKMQIEVKRFPKRWEDVIVETWPSSGDALRAYRDYRLIDKEGKDLALAVSQWMVLDIKKRKPVRLPNEILELGLKASDHVLNIDKQKIQSADKSDFSITIAAGREDLDMNAHVNDVKYIEWMINHNSVDNFKKKCIAFTIEYLSELTCGNRVKVKSSPKDKSQSSQLHHTIQDSKSGKIIAQAISRWA